MHPHVAKTNSKANASLTLGVIGFFIGWCMILVPNVIAIVLGHMALREIRQTGEPGRSNALAGLWLAYIPVVSFIAGIAFMVFQPK